jgi:hypothetical protein
MMLKKVLLLTVAAAAAGFAQGALSPNSSFYATPTYGDVTKVGTGHGWLAFDAKTEVRFVPKEGEEMHIPYRAIRNLQYERTTAAAEPTVDKKGKLRIPKKLKFIPKHQVRIQYDAPSGQETATLWLENHNYQNVLGTLQAKTGLSVQRTGESW